MGGLAEHEARAPKDWKNPGRCQGCGRQMTVHWAYVVQAWTCLACYLNAYNCDLFGVPWLRIM